MQVYFAHEGDTVSSCTHVSAERKKLPEKRMKGNMARGSLGMGPGLEVEATPRPNP